MSRPGVVRTLGTLNEQDGFGILGEDHRHRGSRVRGGIGPLRGRQVPEGEAPGEVDQ